jgi:hypothetical protein
VLVEKLHRELLGRERAYDLCPPLEWFTKCERQVDVEFPGHLEVGTEICSEEALAREDLAFVQDFVCNVLQSLTSAWLMDQIGLVVVDALLARDPRIALCMISFSSPHND